MGTATEVINQLLPLAPEDLHLVTHTHNLYLQVFLDTGFVGFIGWMATLMLAIHMAWKVYRSGMKAWRAGWIAGIGAGLFCSQAALMVHGLTDAVTWGMVRPAPLVWAIWGLAMSMGSLPYKENPAGSE
jgi:putative inorganic carbon (HCO3(-)) transporter